MFYIVLGGGILEAYITGWFISSNGGSTIMQIIFAWLWN